MRADGEGLVLGVEVVVLRLSVDFGQCHSPTRADTTGCNAPRTVAEDVALWCISVLFVQIVEDCTYSNNIKEADDDSKDARRHQEPPERQSQRLLACSLLVHVTQHVESEDHHGAAQSHETMSRTKQRPVASEKIAEERALRDNEEQANNGCNDMTCSIEKEELLQISPSFPKPSIKHTLETMKVLTSMTMLLATTEASAMMLRPLWTLRMM